MKNYYIPIKSTSLAHYFSRGLICPVKYINNRIEDIQNQFEDYILFTTKRWTENTDCCIEVILKENEKEKFEILSDNFSLINTCLPISRVKKIYFNDEKQKDTTIWNINSGAAFVPEHLLTIEEKKEKDFIDEQEINTLDPTSKSTDLTEKIKKYDETLGALALMRLGGESFMNYSTHYFSTLAYFNSLIKEELCKNKKNIDAKFHSVFEEDSIEWRRVIPYTGKNLTNNDIKKIAQDEGVILTEKNGLFDLDKIKSKPIFILTLFATYGNSKRKSLDDFISSFLFSEKYPIEKKEGYALLFGMHNGYSVFRNKYKISNMEKDVKFKLDSKLDYYTIESIYQYTFNNKSGNTGFDYLDSLYPQKKPQKLKGYKTYQLFDKLIIEKKRYSTNSTEYLQKFMQKNPLTLVYAKITNLVNSWLPSYIRAKEFEIDGQKYFEDNLKQHITQYLLQYAENVESDIKEELGETIAKLEDEKTQLYNELKLLEKKNENFQNQVNEHEERIKELFDKNNLLVNKNNEMQKEFEQEKEILLSQLNSSKGNSKFNIEKEKPMNQTEVIQKVKANNSTVVTEESEVKNNKVVSVSEPQYDYSENQIGIVPSEELSRMKVADLKELAKKMGISGCSKKQKKEIIHLIIQKNENSNLFK